MKIVAINQLGHLAQRADPGSSVEDEARALATDLGSAAYDERLNLNAGFPSIALVTDDEVRARSLLAKLRARGHDVLLGDGATMTPAEAMISLRRFILDPDEIVAGDRPDFSLPYEQIAVLVRGTHRRQIESHSEVKEKNFDMGRAIISGGLVLSKTVKRNVTTTRDETEEILYVFRRDGETHWILRENETHYNALGAAMTTSTRGNFLATAALLKTRAPHAAVDDRLLSFRRIPERAVRAGTQVRTLASSEDRGSDLLAHLIALSHLR